MDRRDFLKTTSTVIAGATLAPGSLAAGSPPRASANAVGRMILPINRNWRYNKSYVEGAHARDFDDSSFERVVVPHTNIRLWLPKTQSDLKTQGFQSFVRLWWLPR